MMQMLATVIGAFFVLLLIFRALELTQPRERRQPLWRKGFLTDAAYWVFTAFVTRGVTRLAIIAVAIPVALYAHGRVEPDLIRNGFGPLSRLPLWVQAIAILLLSDLISYWGHRLFHGPRLWRFHAIHHSSDPLDWLSSVRVHPINDVIMRVMSALPVLALGFAPKAVAGVVPLLTFMAIVVHANVDWDWGPFRSVLASPRFHRWHHTSQAEARDKNFAGVFPIWDILFGTYYMPRGQVPRAFGVDEVVPDGLWAQLMYPFRRH